MRFRVVEETEFIFLPPAKLFDYFETVSKILLEPNLSLICSRKDKERFVEKRPYALLINRYHRIPLRLVAGNGDKSVTDVIHFWQH